MRPDESFVRQPIRALQTMLRVIAADDPQQVNVIPDGVYTRQTADAVSSFQRRYGLPVTGTTDQRTWEAIAQAYRPALIRQDKAQSIQVHLNPGQVLRSGDATHQVAIAQIMLYTLFEGVPGMVAPTVTGELDGPTEEALRQLQRLSGLPETGELDKVTWKHLALQYSRKANELSRQQ
jgi:peptidoglycan hydrolase-like protein with peptidoglycan-binding domain